MPLNLGYVEATRDDQDIVVRGYYDANWMINNPEADPGLAPLVDGGPANGGRGWCLDITNKSGAKAALVLAYGNNQMLAMAIQKGNPVTTGPQSGRSRKAADLATVGMTTRNDVGNLQLIQDVDQLRQIAAVASASNMRIMQDSGGQFQPVENLDALIRFLEKNDKKK